MEKNTRRLRWMRLDNAALIFPAALRRHWSIAFRLSFTFRDPVDPALLQLAVDAAAPRFPSVFVRLRRSAFWYYLEEVARPPIVRQDSSRPLVGMTRREVGRCAVRVLYYRNRMAVEFFHAVTVTPSALARSRSWTLSTRPRVTCRKRSGSSSPRGRYTSRLSRGAATGPAFR